jgi:hypothetical protein
MGFALLAELLEFQASFEGFDVFVHAVIHGFARRTLQFDHVVL